MRRPRPPSTARWSTPLLILVLASVAGCNVSDDGGGDLLPAGASPCVFETVSSASLGNWFDPSNPTRLFVSLAQCTDPADLELAGAWLDGAQLAVTESLVCGCANEPLGCVDSGQQHCSTPGESFQVIFDHQVDVSTWDAPDHSGRFLAELRVGGTWQRIEIPIEDRFAEVTCQRDRADCQPTTCTPFCGSWVCGSDGCGGSCGGCLSGQTCVSGQCRDQAPSCPAGCGSPTSSLCCEPPFCAGDCVGSACC